MLLARGIASGHCHTVACTYEPTPGFPTSCVSPFTSTCIPPIVQTLPAIDVT